MAQTSDFAEDRLLIKVAEGVGRAIGTAGKRWNELRGRSGREMALDLGEFAAAASFDQLSQRTVEALKLRVLDSLGCAIGALAGTPIRRIREQLEEFGEGRGASLIGSGSAAPDRAAFYNTALVRYLDFMDNFMATGETCHPADNLGSVLAAAESADASGRDFLTALAVAYQVQ